MKKPLSEMTLQELWQLFPIFLVAARTEEWAAQYARMEAELRKMLGGFRVEGIHHIGSTAIRGIWAKPIVDILVEIAAGESMEAAAVALERGGFRRMRSGGGRMSFNKGYTEDGFADEVFHLHLRRAGDCDEIFFRDYLNAHPDVAKSYESLKLELAPRFEHDRDGYTDAKGPFIREYTALGRQAAGLEPIGHFDSKDT